MPEWEVKHLSDALLTWIAPRRTLSTTDPLEPEVVHIDPVRHLDRTVKERTHESVASATRIITSFQGTVDRIEGDLAYVTLTDPQVGQCFGTLEVDLLAECGIGEHDDFTGTLEKRKGQIVLSYAPLPRRTLTEEEWQSIRKKADELRDDDFGSS
jgi:hypothetical protein